MIEAASTLAGTTTGGPDGFAAVGEGVSAAEDAPAPLFAPSPWVVCPVEGEAAAATGAAPVAAGGADGLAGAAGTDAVCVSAGSGSAGFLGTGPGENRHAILLSSEFSAPRSRTTISVSKSPRNRRSILPAS